MTLHTTVTTRGDQIVVALEGHLDLASVATLHSDLARVIRQHPGSTVIVDLDAISAFDDLGLGVLLGAAASARDGDGDLEVVSSRPAVRDRLERTRFDRAVSVRATIA